MIGEIDLFVCVELNNRRSPAACRMGVAYLGLSVITSGWYSLAVIMSGWYSLAVIMSGCHRVWLS